MPLQATSGAASYDAFGGGAAAVPQYIEDVFSTWLYTGNSTTGGTQTITNNIDLSTKGGMVWVKGRSAAANNMLYDTTRGAGTGATSGTNKALSSNLTSAQGIASTSDYLSAFSTTGFSVTQGGATTALRSTNYNNVTYSSWTLRKQPKFFDVVTYTGTGSATTVAHNLGSTPGVIIVKDLSNPYEWYVYHRSLGSDKYLWLNATDASQTSTSVWNNTAPTSTNFSLGTTAEVNRSGDSFVAYLFAHNAGGFGLTGTDNVISCGSFTTDGSGNATVNLGYEAQWVLMKNSSGAEGWMLFDNMRGLVVQPVTGNFSRKLVPSLTDAESDGDECRASSTGFNVGGVVGGATYIYIAIRRGPMKVPTDATKVFKPTTAATDASAITTNFPVDLFTDWLTDSTYAKPWVDRLRGSTQWLTTTSTAIEASSFTANLASNVSYTPNFFGGSNIISYAFQRAPSFFDEVCFTGTGSNTTVSHNLAAVPEFIVVKKRNAAGTNWFVYSPTLGNTNYILLNSNNGSASGTNVWNSTTPTSSVFSVGTNDGVNGSANTYVAYLFATCAGVSKVGSYTGNGSTQTINCGFGAGGARFVLIKRTDTTGDWYAYDTARGMTALTDPYTLVNTTSAQVATLGSVTTVSTGFALNSAILAAINTNAATYIFLAIA